MAEPEEVASRAEATSRAHRGSPLRTATLYLVRHGRTSLNAEGLLRGHLDVELDDVGRREAAALGAQFRGLALTCVVTSPLVRARATAAAIAEAVGCVVEPYEELIDRDYGPWSGHAVHQVVTEFGSVDAAPGVEPVAALTARVTRALEGLAHRVQDAPAVVVAHDAVNRHALAALVPALGPADGIPQRTGCWNRLDRRPGGWRAPIVDACPDDGRRP